MATAAMKPIDPKRHTIWANHKEKRLFLVVDTPDDGIGSIVLMEIREWPEDEPRTFQHLSSVDWMLLTQDKQSLKPYLPKL